MAKNQWGPSLLRGVNASQVKFSVELQENQYDTGGGGVRFFISWFSWDTQTQPPLYDPAKEQKACEENVSRGL